MTPARAVLVERAVLLMGFLALVVAVAALDWRAGLALAGTLLILSSLDLRWRRS
jgi:uncharacterized membrane protein